MFLFFLFENYKMFLSYKLGGKVFLKRGIEGGKKVICFLR